MTHLAVALLLRTAAASSAAAAVGCKAALQAQCGTPLPAADACLDCVQTHGVPAPCTHKRAISLCQSRLPPGPSPPIPPQGAEFYVAAVGGDDSNPGTSFSAPFATLQRCLDAVPLQGGGTCWLGPGRHDGTRGATVRGPVTISGSRAMGAPAVLDGSVALDISWAPVPVAACWQALARTGCAGSSRQGANCAVCVGQHQHDLRLAGCSSEAVDTFCAHPGATASPVSAPCVYQSSPLPRPVWQLWATGNATNGEILYDGYAVQTPARFPNAKLADDTVFKAWPGSNSSMLCVHFKSSLLALTCQLCG
jgi:hypothetical protein